MDVTRWFRPAISALSVLACASSIVALVWVWQWSVNNNSDADGEHQLLLRSAFMACAIIATAAICALLIDEHKRGPAAIVVVSGASGAFVAVLTSVALTMLVMWMFRSHGAGPSNAERALFEFSYLSAAALSLVLGTLAAFANAPPRRMHRYLAAALAVMMASVAFGYLVVGSSELNKCQVKIEFPLSTNSGECSGY